MPDLRDGLTDEEMQKIAIEARVLLNKLGEGRELPIENADYILSMAAAIFYRRFVNPKVLTPEQFSLDFASRIVYFADSIEMQTTH